MTFNLTAEEIRVLGSLMEKEKATPEYYPLTLNALTNACNQKSSREPVVAYSDELVSRIVQQLMDKKLVYKVTGYDMRVPRYQEQLSQMLSLEPDEFALLCVLMLRGAQSTGELRQRSERLFVFSTLVEVEQTLEKLSVRPQPLTTKAHRSYGRDNRFVHLLSGPQFQEEENENLPSESISSSTDNEYDLLQEKVSALQSEVRLVQQELATIKEQFAQFKKQFE